MGGACVYVCMYVCGPIVSSYDLVPGLSLQVGGRAGGEACTYVSVYVGVCMGVEGVCS